MFTKQIYAHVMCEDSFFKLTVKITELCHKILKFSVLCSLISDLCIDLPIAKIGGTGLCVLQMGGGGAYKRGIDDHSTLSKIRPYFGVVGICLQITQLEVRCYSPKMSSLKNDPRGPVGLSALIYLYY